MRKSIGFLILISLFFQCTKDKLEFNALDSKLLPDVLHDTIVSIIINNKTNLRMSEKI